MKKTILSSITGLLALALLFISLSGCGPKYRYVYPTMKQYSPYFQNADHAYRGKRILLNDIYNYATNTSVNGFFSENNSVFYDTGSLTSFTWYALKKAFQSVGMRVYAANDGVTDKINKAIGFEKRKINAPSGTPALQVTIMSLNDIEGVFTTTLTGTDGRIFKHEFKVHIPRVNSKALNNAALEKRSFKLMSNLVSEILKNKKFQEVFLRQ